MIDSDVSLMTQRTSSQIETLPLRKFDSIKLKQQIHIITEVPRLKT